MALTAGMRVDRYDIVGIAGQGGMGAVYRARDARLQRDVAIKVLPDLFAHDPERRSRFEREAQTLAALNHPNIAQLYGVLDLPAAAGSPSSTALVMEFVDGEDLAARLARGPLPIDEAVAVARQIADALEAAHEIGVVHRDLKPANVKIRPDGTVKVLDFGLAKAWSADGSPESLRNDAGAAHGFGPADSPTFTSPATQHGVILGTAAYMSPEQARGRVVDRRTDVWAFGAVFVEMLTGRTVFGRESVTDTLAAIIKDDVPFGTLPPATPPALRGLLARCLDRDPRLRLRDIGEARVILSQPMTAAAAPPAAGPRSNGSLVLALAAIVLLGALAAWLAWRSPTAVPTPLRRLELPSAVAASRSFAISPDGRAVAYITGNHLYVRAFSSLRVQDLGSLHVTADQVFWSPDSQTIGFTSEQTIVTIPAGGGPAFVACHIPGSGRLMRLAWLTPGTMVFSVWRDGLYTVPATGGAPVVYASIDPSTDVDFHGIAVISPTRLLAALHRRGDDTEALVIVENGRRTPIGPVGSFGSLQYDAGDILFQRPPPNSGVWAMPFNGATADLSTALLIEPGVDRYSASAEGTLIARVSAPERASLVRVDRSGAVTDVPGSAVEVAREGAIAVSPDGSRAALFGGSMSEGRLIVRDLRTGADTPLTDTKFEDTAATRVRPVRPQWLPSGDQVVYGTGTVEAATLVVQRVDGASAPHQIAAGYVGAVSPDGRTLLFLVDERGRGRLRRADIRSDGSTGPAERVFTEQFEPSVTDIAWSPDGQRFAYAALVEPGGKSNVYISNFPDTTRRWLLFQGGTRPRFGRDSRQILFVAGLTDEQSRPYGALTAAQLADDGRTVRIDSSSVVATSHGDGGLRVGSYDVAPDGRVLLLKTVPVPSDDAARAIVIENWPAALRR